MSNNVSIALAYHNRLKQTNRTLCELQALGFCGQIVICDDFSSQNESAELLKLMFPMLDIKIVTPHEKKINPCFAYNTALRHCDRDFVIIQNPECCWVGDVAEYVTKYLQEGAYIAFACLWVDSEESTLLIDKKILPQDIKGKMWVNHSVKDPRGLHFCAAVRRKDLDSKLFGGFDERFADGVWYDDNELLFRVKKELDFSIVDSPYVVHQFHTKSWESTLPKPRQELIAKNKALLEHTIEFYNTPHFSGIFPKGTSI